MVRCLQVIIAFCLVACSTAPAIVQDKPQPNQCFDGPFNIFRLNTEQWKPIASDGNALFVIKNPDPRGLPQAIVLIVMNGGILRYGYLDGQNFRSFMLEGDCYREETLSPELSEGMKQLILKLLKEQHV
jgi:hypothetical protein